MVTAFQMAEVYGNRMHVQSIFVVDSLLRTFQDSPTTVQYWNEVKTYLTARFGEQRT